MFLYCSHFALVQFRHVCTSSTYRKASKSMLFRLMQHRLSWSLSFVTFISYGVFRLSQDFSISLRRSSIKVSSLLIPNSSAHFSTSILFQDSISLIHGHCTNDLSKLNKNGHLFIKELYDFIQFHSTVIQLSLLTQRICSRVGSRFKVNSLFRHVRNASDLVQSFIMIICTWSCAALATAAFAIKMELVEHFLDPFFELFNKSNSIFIAPTIQISGTRCNWYNSIIESSLSIHLDSWSGVYLLWALQKDEWWFWGNLLCYHEIQVVFMFNWNKENAIDTYAMCPAADGIWMFWKHFKQPRHSEKGLIPLEDKQIIITTMRDEQSRKCICISCFFVKWSRVGFHTSWYFGNLEIEVLLNYLSRMKMDK